MRVPTTYLKPDKELVGERYSLAQKTAIPNKKLDAWYEAFLRGNVGREIKVSIKYKDGEFDRPCCVKSGAVIPVTRSRRGFGL